MHCWHYQLWKIMYTLSILNSSLLWKRHFETIIWCLSIVIIKILMRGLWLIAMMVIWNWWSISGKWFHKKQRRILQLFYCKPKAEPLKERRWLAGVWKLSRIIQIGCINKVNILIVFLKTGIITIIMKLLKFSWIIVWANCCLIKISKSSLYWNSLNASEKNLFLSFIVSKVFFWKHSFHVYFGKVKAFASIKFYKRQTGNYTLIF